MLWLNVNGIELFDENNNEFIQINDQTLQLEHSLISVSKWEAKWKKPFLHNTDQTPEETLDYVRCMTINHVDANIYLALTDDNIHTITEYIEAPMTATTFKKDDKPPSRQIITSELIYYWMIASNIPMECEKWHLNRLLTLVRICNIKNEPPKKQRQTDIAQSYKNLNEQRLAEYNTPG